MVLAVLYRIELEKAQAYLKKEKRIRRGEVKVCLGYSRNYKQRVVAVISKLEGERAML